MADNHSKEMAEKIATALQAAMGSSGEPYVFSNDEVTEIQALLKLYRRVETLRWAGKYALWTLVTAGLVISNLERLRDFFK